MLKFWDVFTFFLRILPWYITIEPPFWDNSQYLYFSNHQTSKSKSNSYWVVVSNMFYFHPYLGKISDLTSIFFQMGWLKPPTRLVFVGEDQICLHKMCEAHPPKTATEKAWSAGKMELVACHVVA